MKTSSSQPGFPLILILTFAVLAGAILAGGYSFYVDQERLARQSTEDALQVVARFKTNQVIQWRAERLGDATVIMENTIAADEFAQWLTTPTPELTETLLRWLRSIQEAYSYRDVLLLDAQGNQRLSALATQEPVPATTQATVAAALRDRRALMTDLYQPANGGSPRLDVVAPLFLSQTGQQQPAGAMVLDVDARQFLYPLIQSWPLPRGSAETLLVERQGDQVLFLNDLRYEQNTALRLMIPLSQLDLPAVQAVQNVTGIVVGRDYRGVEVVAALQPVSGTSWYMVAKQDAAEVFAAGRSRGALILGLMSGLLVITLGGVSLVWQRQRSRHYRTLYETEVKRRKAEAQLEEQYILLNGVMQGTSDAIAVKDLDGRYLLVNPAREKLIGRPAAEILGRDSAAVLPADFARELMKADRQAVESGETVVTEQSVIVDGEMRHYVITTNPLRYGSQITGEISVAHDITGRKQMEERLRESTKQNAFLAELIEASSQPFAVGYPDGQMGLCNSAYLALVGYAREELEAIDWAHDLTPPEWLPIERAKLAELEQSGRTVRYEKEYIRKDGTRVPVELFAHVGRDDEGQVKYYYTFLTDISDRQRAEAAREELLRELRQQTTDLEDLLYVSSHDLRSPLVNIQGFSQRLEKAAAELRSLFETEPDDENLRHEGLSIVRDQMPTALHYIVASVQKMDALINGLLQTSRLGRLPIHLTRLNMNALIDIVADAHAYQIDQTHAQIEIDDLPSCWGDAVQINQVFANLVDNALKYRDGDRPLTIHVSGWEEDDRVVYCVEDTGQGIKPEHHDRIWRLFYRLEPRGSVTGDGLGLATVRLIVQRHRGQAWLESKLGRGSRFFVALPIHKPANISPETEG